MRQVNFKFITGNWYKFILRDNSEMIAKFKGESEEGIIFIGCNGQREPFPIFKEVSDLGNENPC